MRMKLNYLISLERFCWLINFDGLESVQSKPFNDKNNNNYTKALPCLEGAFIFKSCSTSSDTVKTLEYLNLNRKVILYQISYN